MKDRLTAPLFPSGILPIHSASGMANTTESTAEVAKRTAILNTSTYLRERFFNGFEHMIFTHQDHEGGIISILEPAGKYRPDSVLIIATTEARLAVPSVEPHTLYDLPTITQNNYWNAVLKLLDTNPDLLYMENASLKYSDESHRMPRTIGVPHGQIGSLKNVDIEQVSDANNPALSTELEFDNNFIGNHASDRYRELHRELKSHYPKSDPLKWQMYARFKDSQLPRGYAIGIKGDITTEKFAEFMRTHHKIYSKISQEAYEQLNTRGIQVKPQPSYCLYISKKGDEIYVFFSPLITSHAGVNERGKLYLHRSPEHPHNEEASKEYAALIEEYKKILNASEF